MRFVTVRTKISFTKLRVTDERKQHSLIEEKKRKLKYSCQNANRIVDDDSLKYAHTFHL